MAFVLAVIYGAGTTVQIILPVETAEMREDNEALS